MLPRSDLKDYWISCDWCTCLVRLDDKNIIRYTAPLLSGYLNRPLDDLLDWLKSSSLNPVQMREINRPQ